MPVRLSPRAASAVHFGGGYRGKDLLWFKRGRLSGKRILWDTDIVVVKPVC